MKEMTMDTELQKKMEDAIWCAASLFNRNKTSGSSANLSFLHDGIMYITAGGSCFGRLDESRFSAVSLDGEHLAGPRPSKEWPLHLIVYQHKEAAQAVIHVHSLYSILWSTLPHKDTTDIIPPHTPYLGMKVGKVGLVPFAKPGSEELFRLFEERVDQSDGFILGNHGPVVAGKNIMDAFYNLEELEESAHIAWELR